MNRFFRVLKRVRWITLATLVAYVFSGGVASAGELSQKQIYELGIYGYDAASCSAVAATLSENVSGKISPLAGQGMSTNAQNLFQQYAVGAGTKYHVDPNFVAAFYYVERGHTDDSTNNADAANGIAATGDGKWLEPAPPVGTGRPYITNGLGYAEPYGLSDYDKTTYGFDGDGDGKVQLYDLADAMFTAANFLVQLGHATDHMTDDQMFSAAKVYNNSFSYAQSVVNIVNYLETGGSRTVPSQPTATGNGPCSTPASSAMCSSASQISGDARILAAAKCYGGIYYEWGGGHQGYDAFKKGCPDPLHPPNNQPYGGAVNGDPAGVSGNPSPCGLDCSGLVSVALDDAFQQKFMWIVGLGTPGSSSSGQTGMGGGAGTQYWQSIPIKEAQPGDIVTVPNDHVEIVDHVSGNTVYTFGAHDTGRPISATSADISYYTGGAWHWTGPQS